MIRLLADQNLYQLSEYLPTQVELTTYDPNIGIPLLDGFDAWFIRSVTKINNQTIKEFPNELKFIGTGSSGTDHVDKSLFKENHIQFVDAKGSNANVVAEYVTTSLLMLADDDPEIFHACIGIIGVGAVGSQVNKLVKKLGFETKLYDPPRQKRESSFTSDSLDEVLNCEILTLHLPLEKKGDDPTYHWLDEKKLAGKSYKVIINAARGGVTDEDALLDAKKNGRVEYLVTDVWENEPLINAKFMAKCSIATPHIAGSSVQSKMNASKVLIEKLCSFYQLDVHVPELSDIKILHGLSSNFTLSSILNRCNPINEYDFELRKIADEPNLNELFARLRTDFPYRHEFGFIQIPDLRLEDFPLLKKLGLKN